MAARSPPKQQRWQRRAEARPEEILEAALAEFTERGFDAARMEDVAKRAGLSKAGVYLYFPSKNLLLEALIEAKVAPIAQQVRALAEHGGNDPLGTLRMIAAIAAQKLRDADVIAVPRLVVGLSGRFPDIAEYYRTHVAEVARGALEDLIEAAMQQGSLRRADVKAVSRAMIGPFFFEAMWTHVLRGESTGAPDQDVHNYLDILLKGLEPRP